MSARLLGQEQGLGRGRSRNGPRGSGTPGAHLGSAGGGPAPPERGLWGARPDDARQQNPRTTDCSLAVLCVVKGVGF